MSQKNILLHICCGICSSYPIVKLREDGFNPVGFFYNPNIDSEEEYTRRLSVAFDVAGRLACDLIVGEYDKQGWSDEVIGLQNEPEGGARCVACFKMRLNVTCKKAQEMGGNYFTTTLTVSPHKNAVVINEIGHLISPESFIEYDFKKNDGFKQSMDFAGKHSLYCQHYCGCEYSRQKK